ncbi:MAG: MBL fold metallo-hydrolase [Thermoproteota archaeon]|nr:MBL fold metallo-hydrolase [Thermoproteota archaeon]
MSIENLTPKKGEVAFQWFNRYAGVTIKTPTRTLVIDPADVNPKTFQTVDTILITHEHYDHLDQAIIKSLHERTGCAVIADPTSTKRLENVIDPDKLFVVYVGSELKVDDVFIKAEPCNHPPASTPITFLITSKDGVKIYHSADSLPFPEMKKIREETQPDIAFCTVGVAPGASPKTGVEIAKLIQPKIAVPYHTASTADLDRFAEILAKEAPNIKGVVLEQGRSYKYP